MTEFQLPHVPSQLIRLALDDLLKVEAMPDVYEVNMGEWHMPQDNRICSVCLAGSVLAMHFNTDVKEQADTDRYGDHNERALLALNEFRHADNDWWMEDGCVYINATPIVFDTHIPYYEDDRVGFHTAMRALADAFEASGQ